MPCGVCPEQGPAAAAEGTQLHRSCTSRKASKADLTVQKVHQHAHRGVQSCTAGQEVCADCLEAFSLQTANQQMETSALQMFMCLESPGFLDGAYLAGLMHTLCQCDQVRSSQAGIEPGLEAICLLLEPRVLPHKLVTHLFLQRCEIFSTVALALFLLLAR